jgi:hypothetical protein
MACIWLLKKKLGFFSVTKKQSSNPCKGKLLHLQDQGIQEFQRIKNMMLVLFDVGVTTVVVYHQTGC